jgi:hypothetical protein
MQSQANSSSTDWEVMLSTGERLLLNEKDAVPLLRHHLLMGKAKLSNRCRLHKPVTKTADSEEESQQHKTPTEWKPLQEYADHEFNLCILYNPAKAWADCGAMISFFVMIVPVATVCNAFFLVLYGVETGAAIFWGALLFVSTPTVIGFPIVAILIAKTYSISAFWIVMLTPPILLFVSVPIASAPGYIIGWVLGLTRPKLLE